MASFFCRNLHFAMFILRPALVRVLIILIAICSSLSNVFVPEFRSSMYIVASGMSLHTFVSVRWNSVNVFRPNGAPTNTYCLLFQVKAVFYLVFFGNFQLMVSIFKINLEKVFTIRKTVLFLREFWIIIWGFAIFFHTHIVV